MKKIVLFITAIFIFVLLGAGGNVEDSAVHKLVSGDWIVSQSGTDTSLFRGSVDSLNMQISDSTQFALDSTRVMIKDSVNYVQTLLDDSIKASDHREILRSDSINTALRLAMIDSSKAIWTDSISQATVVIPNDIKIKGNDLTFGNGASITNPSSGILSLNSGIVSIPSDSTYAGQAVRADRLYADNIVMPNGAVISNVHADSLKLTEANTIIDGNAKVNGLLTLTEGTSTTFTQALNRLTIAGDSLSIRSMTNINPYRATSPQSTTVIGMDAGKSGMNGGFNFIAGYQTGVLMTNGLRNTMVGALSGNYTATGSDNNTFLGFYSGYKSQTDNNTFIGAYSGFGSTSPYAGSNNSALGMYSAYNISTGSYNTYLGSNSAYNSTTGSFNIAIGDSSGYTNTTGSRNVFIGYKAIGTATSSDQFILQSDNGSNVQRLMQGSFADSSLTVNGNLSYKKPFGKFHRIYTQTPANPNAWENIRWNEKHAETTSHFTATADSQGVIISKAGIYAVRCVSKMLWTGSAATTVSSYFRLWQGKGAAITKELRTSQHTSVEEKNTSNANDEFFWGSRYFAAGDTVYAQWRTSNVGNLIQGSAIFANPTSASIVIEYIKER